MHPVGLPFWVLGAALRSRGQATASPRPDEAYIPRRGMSEHISIASAHSVSIVSAQHMVSDTKERDGSLRIRPVGVRVGLEWEH